jgi:ABC-2 type transport system permease protein
VAIITATARGGEPSVTTARWPRDVVDLAGRQLRCVARSPAALMPALAIPLLFYAVQRGSLDGPLGHFGVARPGAFLLPVALLMAVSSGGAGLVLVEDIQSGYLDKLLLTGVRPGAVLAGAIAGDLARTLGQALLVVAVGAASGAAPAHGIAGVSVLLALALGWTVAFGAVGYVIALRTASARAVQSAVMLFFPFVFLTSAFAPQGALAGWMGALARANPITYLLDAMRATLAPAWHAGTLLDGALAALALAVLTVPLAIWSFRARVSR